MGNTTSPLYAQQLQIGHWLQVVGRPVRDRVPQGDDTDVDCSHALREIAAQLHQADLVPGGPLLGNGWNIQRPSPPCLSDRSVTPILTTSVERLAPDPAALSVAVLRTPRSGFGRVIDPARTVGAGNDSRTGMPR
jgi:hypothetical protein